MYVYATFVILSGTVHPTARFYQISRLRADGSRQDDKKMRSADD